MPGRQYYVYLMASYSGTLYVGVTNDLARRVHEHKHQQGEAFTSRYHVSRLVYFEATPDARSAIAREKEIKRWRREKKLKLVEASNPQWHDLAEDWEADNGPG